jgi:hypothetical protein
LKVEAVDAPRWVHGTDGREHAAYDLAVTNVFSADATLESLEVRGHGRRFLRLRGAALAAVTTTLRGGADGADLGGVHERGPPRRGPAAFVRARRAQTLDPPDHVLDPG